MVHTWHNQYLTSRLVSSCYEPAEIDNTISNLRKVYCHSVMCQGILMLFEALNLHTMTDYLSKLAKIISTLTRGNFSWIFL